MGRFSRLQVDDIFLIFSENKIWQFMQIISRRDNLHDMSDPIFSGKQGKIFCFLVQVLPSVLSVKGYQFPWLWHDSFKDCW